MHLGQRNYSPVISFIHSFIISWDHLVRVCQLFLWREWSKGTGLSLWLIRALDPIEWSDTSSGRRFEKMCCWPRYLTLVAPFSNQKHKWVTIELLRQSQLANSYRRSSNAAVSNIFIPKRNPENFERSGRVYLHLILPIQVCYINGTAKTISSSI